MESADTRLMPGDTAILEIPWGDAGRVRLWLKVHPDDYYDQQVYGPLLATHAADSPAGHLIARAAAAARASRYRLFETELAR